jgi:hypothetical protein
MCLLELSPLASCCHLFGERSSAKEIFQLRVCLHHLPSDREGSALYRLYPQAPHRRRRFTWTTPPSHPVAPTPSFSSSQLPALPCSPSLTHLCYSGPSTSPQSVPLRPTTTTTSPTHPVDRRAGTAPASDATQRRERGSPSPRVVDGAQWARAPADAPSELKVLPRPQIPPLTEKFEMH